MNPRGLPIVIVIDVQPVSGTRNGAEGADAARAESGMPAKAAGGRPPGVLGFAYSCNYFLAKVVYFCERGRKLATGNC